jgi:hypothetical protein
MRKELVDDLADVGVEDAREELRKFFADPKGWAKAFRPRLVERLAERGKELAKKGRTAAALELWSRALALEPKSPELRSLVDGVARRRRISTALQIAGLSVVVAGGVAFGARALIHRHVPAQKPVPAVIPSEVKKPDEPKAIIKPDEPKLEVKRHIPHPAAPKKPETPAVPEVLRVVDLAPTPKNVQVMLDGKSLGAFGPHMARMELPPGPHTITFENPAFYPKTVPIAADQSGRILARLLWKPATLMVKAKPASADVLVDGKPILQAGAPIQIPIDESSLDGFRSVTVHVSAAGYESQKVEVRVRGGNSTEEKVELKPRAE